MLEYIKTTFLGKPETSRQNQSREEFREVLAFARELDHQGLRDLSRLIATSLQFELLSRVVRSKIHEVPQEGQWQTTDGFTWFCNNGDSLTDDGRNFSDLVTTSTPCNSELIDFSEDIIFTWPWNKERLRERLRSQGQFRYDRSNHTSALWLPLRVAFVRNGLHSTTVGIVQRQGALIPSEVYDLTAVYPFMHCDGEFYYRTKDGAKLGEVVNLTAGLLFEIGRFMVTNNNESRVNRFAGIYPSPRFFNDVQACIDDLALIREPSGGFKEPNHFSNIAFFNHILHNQYLSVLKALENASFDKTIAFQRLERLELDSIGEKRIAELAAKDPHSDDNGTKIEAPPIRDDEQREFIAAMLSIRERIVSLCRDSGLLQVEPHWLLLGDSTAN